jgi:hypothetical protein
VPRMASTHETDCVSAPPDVNVAIPLAIAAMETSLMVSGYRRGDWPLQMVETFAMIERLTIHGGAMLRTVGLIIMIVTLGACAADGVPDVPPPPLTPAVAIQFTPPSDMANACGDNGQPCCNAGCNAGLTCAFGDSACAGDAVCRAHVGAYDYCVDNGSCSLCS